MTPTTAPTVSVVIVSRARADALALALEGLSRLHYAPYELIVVADPSGIERVTQMGLSGKIKTVTFDEPNISRARNLGIAVAAGEIVAFIDDDAVPEPTWLTHLTEPFAQAEVASVGGFVIGRNGISFQWKARQLDQTGIAIGLDVDETAPTVRPANAATPTKTEGTNMAVRRAVLAELGGFDENFHFYLDETDLSMRLAAGGYAVAISPLAQVHHGYAPSVRRKANRAVTDLSDIGASTAVFLRKHCAPDQQAKAWIEVQAEQQNRVLRQLRERLLSKAEAAELLQGLHAGYAAGQERPEWQGDKIGAASSAFRAFNTRATGSSTVLAGRIWQRRRLRAEAKDRAAKGENVSLFLFDPSLRHHRVAYRQAGYWEQTGGLWGRSLRNGPALQFGSFAKRLQREVARVSVVRGLGVQSPKE